VHRPDGRCTFSFRSFALSDIIVIFVAENQKSLEVMTTAQMNTMNVELWQSIGAIADSEPLMRRLTRYAKKLAKEKNDPTLMTKEEYFAKLDEAERQFERGEYSVMLPGEDLTSHLKRMGYDI
jgi:hypothetical protein